MPPHQSLVVKTRRVLQTVSFRTHGLLGQADNTVGDGDSDSEGSGSFDGEEDEEGEDWDELEAKAKRGKLMSTVCKRAS
jgi:nucleosome binding factor SPN SPT16 subunit